MDDKHKVCVAVKATLRPGRARRFRSTPSAKVLRSYGGLSIAKGGPSLATADVALSFDRAFAELKGVEPVHIARSFYKNLARRAADLNRWPIRNHFTSTVEENTARIKRERTVLLQSRYEHPLKAALSPLVWSAEKGRPIANSLFTGPLRQQRELASNAIEKAATGPGLHE